MQGKCALSGIEDDLQLSHIYPKFVIKYLRGTSNNGRLRSYDNVNLIRQDGLKKYLLSRESEQRFSVAETWFANNIFHPVTRDGLKNFSYDSHLYYFIISVLWRALQVELTKNVYYNEPYYNQMIACEKQWRSFLYEGYVPYQFRDAFMMVTHPNQIEIPGLPSTQYYLMRNLDLTIVTNDRGCVYIYFKLPRFLFWAPLSTQYFSSVNLIDMEGGYYNSYDIPTDPVINGFIPNRIKLINGFKGQLSPQQENATTLQIEKDYEGFFSSEAGQLIRNGR